MLQHRARGGGARRNGRGFHPGIARGGRSIPLEVHLIDGTYELFRHYHALPSARDGDGREIAAVGGVLTSILGMINGGATHSVVATDHDNESFINCRLPSEPTHIDRTTVHPSL